MTNLRDTSQELRKAGFSGSDHFMAGGHQIINSNRAYAGPRRKRAEWASDDNRVQAVLLKAFPRLLTCKAQRDRAARWMRIIQLYYRLGYSGGATAHEMKIKPQALRDYIRAMNRVAAGLPCNRTYRHKRR